MHLFLQGDTTKAQTVSMLIEENVNMFCSCGFALMSPSIVCFDDSSIILRGTSDANLVSYLQEWVSKKATSLTVQGALLTVDNSCSVTVQSVNQAGCSVASSAKQSGLSSNTKVGIAFGVIGGCVAIVGIILGTSFIFLLKKNASV